jgi:TetR/AcrR family transcriptional repressor of lmrAB and yxaGH operons
VTGVVDRRRRATRQTLVRAATGLFRRRGLAATSVADVCARGGVTKGVFSHHFPGGRAELATEVIRQNGEAVAAQLRAAVDANTSAAARITAIFSAYADIMHTKGSDFGCPVAAGVIDGTIVDPDVGAAASAAFTSWRSALAIAVGDDGLADVVVAALEGAILLARAHDDPDVVRVVGQRLAVVVDRAGRAATRP